MQLTNCQLHEVNIQETQLSLTNYAMHLEVGQDHQNGTIQYVRYGFLLVFYSNFAPKMHRF